MIRLHKEGKRILMQFLLGLSAINFISFYFISNEIVKNIILVISIIIYVLVLQFFRNPKRFTPADGKIVAIEEIEETEYFKQKMLQISIFMSPVNVHVNRYPVSGKIKYSQYHPGAFLVAWHPKSSTLNERTAVVVENTQGIEIMYKQIAGAVARRIINYAKKGDVVLQGTDSGFIRFGSRVDVVLPLDANVLVKVGDKARGGEQVLAELK
jgi:phosphatidylserine decarboxylase